LFPSLTPSFCKLASNPLGAGGLNLRGTQIPQTSTPTAQRSCALTGGCLRFGWTGAVSGCSSAEGFVLTMFLGRPLGRNDQACYWGALGAVGSRPGMNFPPAHSLWTRTPDQQTVAEVTSCCSRCHAGGTFAAAPAPCGMLLFPVGMPAPPPLLAGLLPQLQDARASPLPLWRAPTPKLSLLDPNLSGSLTDLSKKI